MTDEVNEPEHYNKAGIEVIDVIEAYDLPYHLGNVIKYILRHLYKGKPREDLLKAQWYLDRYLDDPFEFELETGKPFPGTPAQAHEAFCAEQEASHTITGAELLQEIAEEDSLTFRTSLASRIAGDTDTAGRIKDQYYKFNRYEIQGYCAYCDAEIAKGQPYVKEHCGFDAKLMFCRLNCVNSLKEWQGR